tara:strand:- start:638 stop:1036 length:399 start_codon:yes stop_codon:yes gene_type:complete
MNKFSAIDSFNNVHKLKSLDKVSKLMNDFRITGTKYNLDKISDKICYKELSDIMGNLIVEMNTEKENLDNYKIKKQNIKQKMIKLILIMYENEVQPKCHNKPLKKDTMTDLESENIKIDNIIKSLLDKINKN